MFFRNLALTLRSMRRHPAYALINIFGLGLGLLVSFIVFLWVQDELSFDRFHTEPDRLFQVMRTAEYGSVVSTSPSVTAKLDDVLDEDYPEIETAAMFTREQGVSFVRGDQASRNLTRFGGPDIFRILTFPFLAGDPETALIAPESVVLSESIARVYFPEHFAGVNRELAAKNILGETLRYENRLDVVVTGVAEDPPSNSSIRFEAVLPFELFARENAWVDNWGSNAFEMFLRLTTGANPEIVSAKIGDVIKDHSSVSETSVLSLQAVQDRYLWSKYENGVLIGGRIDYLRIICGVGFLILLIAAINFTNLATARSAQRAPEIGVRKTFGVSRGGLMTQFLGESMIAAAAALVLAVIGVALLLPSMNSLTEKSMSLWAAGPMTWIVFIGLTMLTGLIAGLYPAVYLSGLGVVRVLKQRDTGLAGGRRLRSGLVIFQFTASMVLIVGTLTIYQQIQFIRSTNLGLDREDVITARLEGGARDGWEAFQSELLRSPAITSVTFTDGLPFEISQSTSDLDYDGRDPDDNSMFYLSSVGHDYVETMRLELTAGRGFDPGRSLDSANVIINESAARKMGIGDPVGKRISVWNREGTVIGVVKDYHMQSMYQTIEPTILRLDKTYAQAFLVRATPGQGRAAREQTQATFQKFSPGYPFDPSFLDAEYEAMYRSEQVIGSLANWFAILAVIIACLGLYGLASFTTSRRTKEIGVRKVLGASVASVAILLSREFALLVGASFAIATPVAWWLMTGWLGSFEYHVQLGVTLFVATGLGMLLLTYATVGLHSMRAASVNPARSLRSE
jgi:putative ABC transport system permease protein